MAEQVSEDKICLKCSADIRPGALFCYSCGSAVETVSDEKANVNGGGNKESLDDENVVQEKFTTNPLKSLGAIEKPVGIPLETPAASSTEEKGKNREKKLVVQKETNLKTAASLRNKSKPPRRKQVEVVWEVPENSSHTWFVLVSLILVLFTVIMLMAMLYLR